MYTVAWALSSRYTPQLCFSQLRIRYDGGHLVILASSRRDILDPQSPRRVGDELMQFFPVSAHHRLIVRSVAVFVPVDVGQGLSVCHAHDGVAKSVDAVCDMSGSPQGIVGPPIMIGELFGNDELQQDKVSYVSLRWRVR